jgi:Leucine-rich repeat (LRR) protein
MDITAIRFTKCILAEFPSSPILLDLAKNLTYLSVNECNLTKISREDLKGLISLKDLSLGYNSIEQLPKGLFKDTPNLEFVSFFRNRIKEIDADIVKPLKNLKYFDLTNNVSIDALYSSFDHYPGNVTLAQLKAAIRKKCVPGGCIIAEMRKEIDILKKDNVALKKEIADLKKQDNAGLKRKFDELETSYNNLSAELKKVKQMKEKQIVCDFTVSVNGKDFRVNREVLATNSPVLKKLMDANRDADHLELKDIAEKTFEELLKFMHTKNPPNNATNLLELFAASGRLEMKELMDATAEILKEKVTLDNAPDIMKLCKKYPHEGLGKKAFNEMKKIYGDL